MINGYIEKVMFGVCLEKSEYLLDLGLRSILGSKTSVAKCMKKGQGAQKHFSVMEVK